MRHSIEPIAHLVVIQQPFLEHILKGSKRMEGRFLQRRMVPYHAVLPGDTLVLKEAGGPVRAIAQADLVVEARDLAISDIADLLELHNAALQLDDAAMNLAMASRYIVLIALDGLHILPQPFPLDIQSRKSWFVLDEQAPQDAAWVQGIQTLLRDEPTA